MTISISKWINLKSLLVSGRVPGDSNHQIDWELNGNDICHHLWMAPKGSEEAFASAGNQTRRSVEIVHPTGNGFFESGCDDRRSDNGQRNTSTLFR